MNNFFRTMRVHNLMEVRAIIKGSYIAGEEMTFDKAMFYKHTGEFICTSQIRDTEFELTLGPLEVSDGYRHITVEV